MGRYDTPRTFRTTVTVDFTTYEQLDPDEFHDLLREALENVSDQIAVAIGEQADATDPADYVSVETIRDIDVEELED
ncbi:MAG TPA: hypothetical protein VNQ73_02575 [Ilumatobacter sp.]|nr:hypothetical protein [Ilumatobacter sp.]